MIEQGQLCSMSNMEPSRAGLALPAGLMLDSVTRPQDACAESDRVRPPSTFPGFAPLGVGFAFPGPSCNRTQLVSIACHLQTRNHARSWSQPRLGLRFPFDALTGIFLTNGRLGTARAPLLHNINTGVENPWTPIVDPAGLDHELGGPPIDLFLAERTSGR